jgi:hypothetical protein
LKLTSHAKAVLGADPRAKGDQSVDETKVVESLGTQLAGYAAHLVQTLSHGVGHIAKGPRRQRWVAVRRPLSLDGHSG